MLASRPRQHQPRGPSLRGRGSGTRGGGRGGGTSGRDEKKSPQDTTSQPKLDTTQRRLEEFMAVSGHVNGFGPSPGTNPLTTPTKTTTHTLKATKPRVNRTTAQHPLPTAAASSSTATTTVPAAGLVAIAPAPSPAPVPWTPTTMARRAVAAAAAGRSPGTAGMRKSSLAAANSGKTRRVVSSPHKNKNKHLSQDRSVERNIGDVVFGDIAFKSWYPSWYPKEVLGEKSGAGEKNLAAGKNNTAERNPAEEKNTGAARPEGLVIDRLYVCPRCFAYSKEVMGWIVHVRVCERVVPGREIYKHGGHDGDGIWSVTEVDGEVESIFCQNLSLFAKLFLDNKSVFFDVSGFNYFLLVHTAPATGDQRIVGFFSKEKMSWDNNNLACILIFPPWQRKGLGSILMGVSYEIARREGLMGGPEKPISDLGKKGYQRYWGAELARWLLQCELSHVRKGAGIVDVDYISRATWIAPEDCLSVLRDMDVVDAASKGKTATERIRIDKAKVRAWVARMGICLERVVDPDGFVEGYGYNSEDDDEEGVEDDEEDEEDEDNEDEEEDEDEDEDEDEEMAD